MTGPRIDQLQSMINEAWQWLSYAQEDLSYGELGMDLLPRAASWSFQQSVEKSLKALLLFFEMDIPRTHDVAFLLSTLTARCSVPDEVTQAALLIAEITPATRYPADDLPAVDRSLAREYHHASKIVVEWVVRLIPSS